MKNPYIPCPVTIKDTLVETEDRMLKTFELTFDEPEHEKAFSYMPGQFAEVSVLGKGESPIGIASSPTEKGSVKFTVMKVGVVTSALHDMAEGEKIGLRGPMGNHYPVEDFKGKNVFIVGGGFAFTTLRSLVVYMLENRGDYGDVSVVYGARTPGMRIYKDELAAWEERDDVNLYQTVDKAPEGWHGREGFVTEATREIAPKSENSFAVVCGPPIMIKFTVAELEALGFPPERILTSLEMRMKCGIGKCGRCNIGPKYVCKDGPVFTLAELGELPQEF